MTRFLERVIINNNYKIKPFYFIYHYCSNFWGQISYCQFHQIPSSPCTPATVRTLLLFCHHACPSSLHPLPPLPHLPWLQQARRGAQWARGMQIAKVYCVLGRRNTADRVMGELLDSEIDMCCYGDIVYCHESVKLLGCAGCKVKCYCNRKHQKKEWRGRFMDHRTLCPFLNRWQRVKRRMKKGMPTRDSLECIKNDFVDMIECKIQKTEMAAI